LNPKQAYGSLKSSSLFTKAGLLLFFIQVIILMAQNYNISIPEYFTKYIISKTYVDSTVKTGLTKLSIRLDGKIKFRGLYLKDSTGFGIKIRNGEFKIKLYEFITSGRKIFDFVNLKKVEIFVSNKKDKIVYFPEIKISNVGINSFILNFNSSIANKQIKGSGIIHEDILATTDNKIPDHQESLSQLKKFYEKNFKKLAALELKNFNLIISHSKNSKILMNVNSSHLKDGKTKYVVEDTIINADFNESGENINLNCILERLTFNSQKQTLSASGISIRVMLTKNNNGYFIEQANIGSNSHFLTGQLSGNYDSLKLIYKRLKRSSEIIFTSKTNSLVSCIRYRSSEEGNSFRGFAKIHPMQSDLMLNVGSDSYKLLAGESVDITMRRNVTSVDNDYPTYFQINATNFSPLETPSGNFKFIGEIKSDLTVEVRHAHGVLGKSKVQGSYSQKWNPHSYEFIIKGNCHPPDINNWFKNWWNKIWVDFTFTEKIPYGDFKITGNWGGETGNSTTFGIIESKELIYKDFKTKDSIVTIKVDENSTLISSEFLNSSKGKIKGFLEFPRKHQLSPILLHFNMDGVYPLNEARSIFGETFEKSIEDLNASYLICNAKGKIKNQTQEQNAENEFALKFQSSKAITFKGIQISNIEGIIEKEGSLTKGSLPRFKIAEGIGQMNFEQESNGSEDTLSFNFSLREANKNAFMNQIILAQKNGSLGNFNTVSIEDQNEVLEKNEKSSLSISLKALGPLNNPLQFEGTGMLQLKESKISQINLLGGLSKSLSGLKIPIPSGALTFNELILPFEVNNESVIFDQLTMNGPLSKITANGNLNIASGTVDILAKLNLAGNFPIPLIKNLVQFADPLSRMTEIKITGDYKNPKWDLLLTTE
jgi:hypothetical protein